MNDQRAKLESECLSRFKNNPTQQRQLFFGDGGKKRSGDWLYDAIIIGGGITGAGVALDLASRGLKVILLEKGDFASGTSSKSTKLVHGGLRYLQNLQFDVTLESLRERQVDSRLAPHLVRDLDFLIPLYGDERFKNLKLKCGLWLYDMMGGSKRKNLHKRISASEVHKRCPGIKSRSLVGGLVYTDCRTDDARHTLEVIKTACAHGATALNYAKVQALVHENMRVQAVDVIDALAPEGSEYTRIRGRVIINATGVWSQQTSAMAGTRNERGGR